MRAVVLCLGLALPGAPFGEPRSGLEFSTAEIRALQASDDENPGMLWVARGAVLWAGQCSSCHAAGSMKGVAARYPMLENGQIITLEQRIMRKRPGLAYESDDLLALTAFLAHQSRGLRWQPRIDDRDVERGRMAYRLRRGQMNLACTHCHDANAGKRLGSETISQGQGNGYPAYRLEWERLGSLQRRLRACLFAIRADLPPFGSQDLLELELFLAYRGRGLLIETPAVRR